MLGNCRVATQLVAIRLVLSSIELVTLVSVITANCGSIKRLKPERLIMACGEHARDPSRLTHKPSALELVRNNYDKMAAGRTLYVS
jgi:hypothetical protein